MSIFRSQPKPPPVSWKLFIPFRRGIEHFVTHIPAERLRYLDEYTTMMRKRLEGDYGLDLTSERELFAFTAGALRAIIIAKDTLTTYPDSPPKLVLETTSRTIGVLVRELLAGVPGVPQLGGDPE